MEKKYELTESEARQLADLISWAVNGSEHGVITYEGWKRKCAELAKFLASKGLPAPHGIAFVS